MQSDRSLLGLNIPEWIAIVNALTVVILVFINAYYLKIAKHQAEAANAQAKESQRQADAAMENLRLAKAQAEQQASQELTTVIAILRGIILDVTFWLNIVKENWSTAPSTVRLVPDDWPLVVYHAGRVSTELREKALNVHTILANANYHITRFLSSRQPAVLEPAYASLSSATTELNHVISVFENFEKSAPLFMR
jgi:hypothetical protein